MNTTTPQIHAEGGSGGVLIRKPRKDSHQARYERFKAAFKAICEAHGGVFSARDCYADGMAAFLIPTRLGELKASIHDDRNWRSKIESIYLKFETQTGGKVYDSLCGYDFNSWSGKWNICLRGETMEEAREECLKSLERRLELLEKGEP